jgi:long-chain acyl-CoA synthetase
VNSTADALRRIEALANTLAALKLEAGDRVAILSENRPEWALTDLACQMIGLATVPIYNSLTSDEIRYILEDSASRVSALSKASTPFSAGSCF